MELPSMAPYQPPGSHSQSQGPHNQEQRVTFLGRMLGYLTIDEAEADYAAALHQGLQEDLSDLDALGFLHTGLRDRSGRPLLVVVARNFPARVMTDKERVFRYLATRLDPLLTSSGTGYSLLWVHTGASYSQNCPGLGWLWRVYERLPSRARASLHTAHVLHCDLGLWLGSMALGPCLRSGLWHKLRWHARLEFCWDVVDKRSLLPLLPAFVAEHDALLEEQPLVDYGIVAPPAEVVGAVPGAHHPPH